MSKYNKIFSKITSTAIQNRISSIAKEEHITESQIIDQALAEKYMPSNSIACRIVTDKLFSNTGSVKQTLRSLFDYNYVYLNDNFKNIIIFCVQYVNMDVITVDVDTRRELDKYLTMMKPIIEKDNTFSISSYNYVYENPSMTFMSRGYFELIIDHWKVLENSSFTYKYLELLTSICNFNESDHCKNKLCNIIIELSKDWNDSVE